MMHKHGISFAFSRISPKFAIDMMIYAARRRLEGLSITRLAGLSGKRIGQSIDHSKQQEHVTNKTIEVCSCVTCNHTKITS